MKTIMKRNKFQQSKNLTWVLSALIVLGFTSCKKQNSEGYTAGTGTPVITRIRTLGKVLTDSVTKTYTTYDTTGTASTTTQTNPPNGYTAQDSTTATGNLNNTYEIIGKNLGSATKLTINGVTVYFNRALGSDSELIFNIPSTIPTTQPQSNTIVVTTLHGSVTYAFTVLPPAPTVLTYSTNDFTANSLISLTGQGFASVTSVKLKTTGDAATIVSQSDSTMVLKMPTSTATTTPLQFIYTSGANTGATAVSSAQFNDLDNAYQVFTDNYSNGWYSSSWGPTAISTTVAKTGTSSFAATYDKGDWSADGFGTGGTGLPTASYNYLSFWIKGGLENYTLYLTADTRGGFGNSDTSTPITVPANVWTYFKLPLSTLNLQGSKQFGFFIQGPNDQNETFYFDDVVLLK